MQVKRRIALNSLDIRGFHGLYDFERRQGGEYRVDAWLEMETQADQADVELEDTLNYERMLEIISEEMNKPTALLESLANRILLQFESDFKSATAAGIKIQKLNPPLEARLFSTSVEQSWTREQS